MKAQAVRYGYIVRVDPGEEIVATLTAFARARGLKSGLVSGLGAVNLAELGFFVRATKTYVRHTFEGEFEILAMTGNLSELDGEPFLHAHLLLSADDFQAFGGHLFRGVVSVTCEAQLVTDPLTMRRVRRADLGFNPIEPQE